MSEKHIGRGGERLGARQTHGFGKNPRHAAHDLLDNAEVIERRTERGKKDDRGQNREGKNHTVRLLVEERAEKELRPLPRETKQFDKKQPDRFDHHAHRREVDDQSREDELQDDADGHHPPRNIFAVGAEQRSYADEHHDAEQAAAGIEKCVHGGPLSRRRKSRELSAPDRVCRAGPACGPAPSAGGFRSGD